MTSTDERRLYRLERRIEELRAWRNARQSPILQWTFTAHDGKPVSMQLGDFWPVHEVPVTFTTEAKIPPAWKGQPVELELWVGGEAFVRLSTGYQAGLNPMHHRFPVVDQAKGGETIGIEVEAAPKGIFGTNIAEPRLERAQFVIPQRETRALERDLTMLREACVHLEGHEAVSFLLDVAEQAIDELACAWPTDTETSLSRYVLGYDNGLGAGVGAVPGEWESEAIDAERSTNPTWSLPPAPRELEPLSNEAISAVNRARTTFANELERLKETYPPVGSLVLTGHAHIDLAWLWPMAETRRKIRRTFSTVLDLMDRYDDFMFNQSSAQAYVWIEEDDPGVFTRIKQRVAEGRWEPSGGMWVESDCNVTGGESFVRQLVYGQRYFEQSFGRRNRAAWLPDVFGFSGGIPQLLRGAGLDGFFTIKLNWNEENKFPYDLFTWEGIDGSQVTAHLFLNPGHGYNANIVPFDTLGTWRNFRGKRRHPESLLAFGWGDGAGGPTEKMLENYARIKDFPALPRLRMGSIETFFANLPPEDKLPKWAGELYLELHRGTLTTQAKTKALNRASEHRLLEAEAFGAIATLDGFTYPHREIEQAWKTLLLNQFHDILPGSSIHEVYEDTHRLLGEVVSTATRVRDEALGNADDMAGCVRIANASLSPRRLRVELPGVKMDAGVKACDGSSLTTQPTDGGLLVLSAVDVPGLGWTTLTIVEAKDSTVVDITEKATAQKKRGGAVLENEHLRVEIGADGTILHATDKAANREVLADRGNQLWAYVDKPYSWDAWDVDEAYERGAQEIGGVEAVEIVESGPVRASVRVSRRWRESTIVQTYRLWAGSQRMDIETTIDWHQRQVMVKALFPMAIHTRIATYETMYGAVQRPTHRNTSWDEARFEVAAHRWADLSETGYGVSLLNDSKYGYGAHDNVLNISLLRSPLYPDPLADEGEHHLTYSFFPHPGHWTTSDVVNEAFALNSPLIVTAGGTGEPDFGFVEADGLPIAVGSLKPADIGDGVILRVYEPHGARGEVDLRFRQSVRQVERVNLMEESDESKEAPTLEGGNTVRLKLGPFEVVTLRIVY